MKSQERSHRDTFPTADLDSTGIANSDFIDGIRDRLTHCAEESTGEVLSTFHLNLGECLNSTVVSSQQRDSASSATGNPHGFPMVGCEVTNEELTDGVHGADEQIRLL